MANEAAVCPYCRAELRTAQQKRCHECNSWLSRKAHLLYPETIWVLVGLFVSIVAAVVAANQAADARAERRAAEQLKKDISVVAENTTKMAFIIADGSSRFGGIPAEHLEVIKQYENAIKTYLPSNIDTEIKNTLRGLDEQIRQKGDKQ